MTTEDALTIQDASEALLEACGQRPVPSGRVRREGSGDFHVKKQRFWSPRVAEADLKRSLNKEKMPLGGMRTASSIGVLIDR